MAKMTGFSHSHHYSMYYGSSKNIGTVHAFTRYKSCYKVLLKTSKK